MEQRYSNFYDLLDNDDGDDGTDTGFDVAEHDQPIRHVIVHVPVSMMHIFEAKEIRVWCALIAVLSFAAGAFGTFAILKGAGAL